MSLPADPWASTKPTLTPTSSTEDTNAVTSALAKERTIKDILQLRDGLRSLLVRIDESERETEKLGRENEMLGEYIDNLCVAVVLYTLCLVWVSVLELTVWGGD